jgi:hypothetical protein
MCRFSLWCRNSASGCRSRWRDGGVHSLNERWMRSEEDGSRRNTKAPEVFYLPRPLIGCGGPQPLAGEQVAGLLLRDPDLNPCFSHDHVFTKCLRTYAVDASSLKHGPPTFPAHCLGYPRSSMCSGGGEDDPAPARRQGHTDDRPPRVTPRDRRAREAALPTVPERRRTAGSGPAAAIPTLLGVSLSQHCPGRRRHPTWGQWPSSERSTGPGTPSTPCSTRSSPSTWRSSCARWRRPATARACHSSSSGSSGSS